MTDEGYGERETTKIFLQSSPSLDAQLVRSGRFLTSTEARITHGENIPLY